MRETTHHFEERAFALIHETLRVDAYLDQLSNKLNSEEPTQHCCTTMRHILHVFYGITPQSSPQLYDSIMEKYMDAAFRIGRGESTLEREWPYLEYQLRMLKTVAA